MEGQFPSSNTVDVGFGRGPDGDVLVANQGGDLRMWSVSSGREIRRLKLDEQSSFFFVRGHNAVAWATVGRRDIVRWIPLVDGEPRLVGTMDKPASAPGVFVLFQSADIDEGGLRLAYAWGRNVYVRSLESWSSPARVVAAHPADVVSVALQPDGRTLAASDLSGGIRIWPTAARSERALRVLENTGYSFLRYSGTGKWLGAWIGAPNVVRLFDLAAPLAGEALQLRGGPAAWLADVAFEPSDRWVATTIGPEIALWPLGERYPRSIGPHQWFVDNLAFTPDGSHLVSASGRMGQPPPRLVAVDRRRRQGTHPPAGGDALPRARRRSEGRTGGRFNEGRARRRRARRGGRGSPLRTPSSPMAGQPVTA